MAQRVTAKQRQLIRDIRAVQRMFMLEPDGILTDHERESWTPRLELALRQLVGSQIVADYTLIDEYLNNIIAKLFFGPERSFVALWRTKRFRLFHHYVLDELSLVKKLSFARAIAPMPATVRRNIERLNALRNAIAHSFFPENLRHGGPFWKGQNIFSL